MYHGLFKVLLQGEELGVRDIMRIFYLHTSKDRYELKVLLKLCRLNVKTIGGFINIPLADL
jgi:hypothetical protein